MSEYHSLSIKEVFRELKSSEKGLSEMEAERRNKRLGYNEMPREKRKSAILIFFSQFNNALVYVLLIAGTLSMMLGEYVDSGVIFGAVILNVFIGFIQENKASQALEKLRKLVDFKVLVLRAGKEEYVESKKITSGDIILLRPGSKIPADARIIEAINLKVNESSLTGESVPSKKAEESVLLGASLGDRASMVYAGTMAVEGVGKAVVTSIGTKTEIGKIAAMVKETKEEKTPLQKRLGSFSRILGGIFSVVCVLIVIVGLTQGRPFLTMLEVGVAVGVASIPEGLTVAVTFILALGMQQILKKKALTKKLVAAETLGSITVICTDKTGTLTEGNMHVAHIVIGEKEFEVDEPGHRQNKEEAKIVSLALQTAMMCNDASVENPDDDLSAWRLIGSPTETALLSAAMQSGLVKDELLKAQPRVAELPFDSKNKFMISLNKKAEDKYVLYEKGAPERLIAKSTKYYHHGKIVKLGVNEKKNLNKTYEELTSRGLRVIGLAVKDVGMKEEKIFVESKVDWEKIDNNLVFIGFIGIKDPLRKESANTIKLCKKAGIRPIMITGDHALTAKAIALEVGLNVREGAMMTGDELDEVSDDELYKLVKKIDVYARVSPHHKLRIVKALQRRGEVVGMTGDGVNDSPALKAADIGIALGTGTDIAKETADIILLDDNFSTIVAAIRQGRVIFNNIRKVITYLISDSFTEVILIVGSILLNKPLAILPVQILWINIVNDGLPHFSLAFERGDDSVMREKPIAKNEPLLSKEMKLIIFAAGLTRDFFYFALFFIMLKKGMDIGYIRTFIFAAIGTDSLVYIFSLRNLKRSIWKSNPFSNKYLLGAVSVSFTFLLLGVYWGPLQSLLSTQALELWSWGLIATVSFLNICMIETIKLFFVVKDK